MESGPWWALVTTWGVVNLVNVLQAVGFLSRRGHGMTVNHRLGIAIAVLAAPASAALVGFALAGSLWWIGPAVFDAFVLLMLVVDYWRPVEFRNPPRPSVLVPYLVLFFGGILLMGLSMYAESRVLWLVTVATAAFLVSAMGIAMRRGTA
jgi:hypothetical protein